MRSNIHNLTVCSSPGTEQLVHSEFLTAHGLLLFSSEYCRAEKHIPKSISVYIKVFGMNVELNIFLH